MTKDHTFEELSLDEMEMVGGGFLTLPGALMVIIMGLVNQANNGNPNPFVVPDEDTSREELQDKWDYTFGMG